MERFDLVPGQVEQADLLQVAERLGDLPEVVVGRIEDLELLLRRAVGDGVEPFVQLFGRPLGVVGDVDRNELGHLRDLHREAGHLRAVVDLQVGQRLEVGYFGGNLLQLAVGDVEVLELFEFADGRVDRLEPVGELAVYDVVGTDIVLEAGLAVDDLILGEILVERRGRDRDAVFGQGPGDRLGRLGRDMDQREELLVTLHAGAVALGEALVVCQRGVVFEQVAVVVRAQIQLDELRELADGCRHVPAEAELADRDLRHAAVGVHLHARLDAPQVGILVEIPVDAGGIVFTPVRPVLPVERLPDFVKRVVVADILVGLVERDADFGLGGLVVLDGEIQVLGTLVGLQQDFVLVVGLVSLQAVIARLEREQRVAFERGGLVAVLDVLGGPVLAVVPEVDRELRGEFFERGELVGRLVPYGQVEERDLVEGVLPFGGTRHHGCLGEVRQVLGDRETHRAARLHVDRQVVRNEAAGHDVEPLFARHAVVDQLVVGIE